MRRSRVAPAAAVATLALLVQAAPALGAALLPDLDEAVPSQVSVATETGPGGAPRYEIAFQSGAANIGDGPLTVTGSRASTSVPMVAQQVVENSDGTTTTYSNVGTLQFASSPTHNHWHYLAFERYQLRRPSDYALIAPDNKTGFCMQDDAWVSDNHPAAAFTSYCQPGNPNATDVTMGVSRAWEDFYVPQKEGQYVEVTGVPEGDYYLVHRANPDRRLLEKDYSNNVSSLLVHLSWPNGMSNPPMLTTGRGCKHMDSCPAVSSPPVATTGAGAAAGQTGGTVAGTVNPSGLDTTYHFDWGTTTSYGQSTPEQALDPTMSDQTVTAMLSGLAPGTTYHFHLVATNSAGISTGIDQQFTTGASSTAGSGTVGGSSTANGASSARGGIPSNVFRLRGLAALPGARARLKILLPGPGRVSVLAKRRSRTLGRLARVLSRGGLTTLVLHARQAVPVDLQVSYTPDGGQRSVRYLRLRLRR